MVVAIVYFPFQSSSRLTFSGGVCCAVFVCSIFLAFFVAWGIGANDVANSFATSVGARALTLKQAVLVAAVCEFGGSMLLVSCWLMPCIVAVQGVIADSAGDDLVALTISLTSININAGIRCDLDD